MAQDTQSAHDTSVDVPAKNAGASEKNIDISEKNFESLGDSLGNSVHPDSDDNYSTDIGINHSWQANGSFFRWFHINDGPAERRLILKLDFSIMAFACVAFWALYIDRAVYQNAYISGMKEDLRFFGNEYVRINSIFLVGYSVSIIPLTVVNTRAPPHFVIPACMVLWGIATTLGTRARSFGELAGYRFLVGLGEGAFFPSIQYVLGAWYRPDEMSRRAGVFYVSGSIGTITTGFLAARISKDLDGSLGRASWQWMFLIAGVITFPIALFGVLTFPGTPSHPNRRLFSGPKGAVDLRIARARMDAVGRRTAVVPVLSRAGVRRLVGRWHVWVLVAWSIIFQQGYLPMNQGTYILWLKAATPGGGNYSTADANNRTTVAPCVGIVAIVTFAWAADRFGARARLPLFAFGHVLALLGLVGFAAYDHTSRAYKWFGIAVSNVENALVPVMYMWANLICAADAEERAFVVSAMLAFAMAFNCWVPLLSMPTVDAPSYPTGYLVSTIMQPIGMAMVVLVYFLHKRELRRTSHKEGIVVDNERV